MNPLTNPTGRACLAALTIGAAGFLVHVIGGRAGIAPVFAVGVAAVWTVSAGFPVLVYLLSGQRAGKKGLAAAYLAGVALTTSTIGATRDTGFEVLNLVAALAITAAVAGLGSMLLRPRRDAGRHSEVIEEPAAR